MSIIRKTVMMCDPPSGWQFGFPKPYTYESTGDPETDQAGMEAWYEANGYPRSQIDQGMLRYCRYWPKELEFEIDDSEGEPSANV